MEPDVEALLVNRALAAQDHFRVGIDECYKLVGILRTHWHGLSGGTAVWHEIGAYFAGLAGRASDGDTVGDKNSVARASG
jgi:hypothetical protein